MKQIGFRFSVEKPDVDEIFPGDLPVEQVAKYLASVKAEYFRPRIKDEVIVTADTVVILGGSILNKPADRNDAIKMLSALSGNTHVVMTGVAIISKEREESFDDRTEVTFQKLTPGEIGFYIDHFQPYDKAGAYGAQDCLPAGMNPCSDEEIGFLRSIGREDLIRESITEKRSEKGITVIREISGSYFNVMGLPIHKVFRHLSEWSPK